MSLAHFCLEIEDLHFVPTSSDLLSMDSQGRREITSVLGLSLSRRLRYSGRSKSSSLVFLGAEGSEHK